VRLGIIVLISAPPVRGKTMQDSFNVSADPDLVEKIRDLVGLHVGPSEELRGTLTRQIAPEAPRHSCRSRQSNALSPSLPRPGPGQALNRGAAPSMAV
jgi:hypothetical protein